MDPFEAALQSTDKDYNWVLGSPRSRRAEAKYDDDDPRRCSAALHACEIAAEKARTRSVRGGNQNLDVASDRLIRHRRGTRPRLISHRHGPCQRKEFERLEEKLEELKKEAAEDLADDGSVDSELKSASKELQETLVDVVPVEQGPPSGLRLLRAPRAGPYAFLWRRRVLLYEENGRRRGTGTGRITYQLSSTRSRPRTRGSAPSRTPIQVTSKKQPTCRRTTRANHISSGSARWN